jgi:hypothetical protein
VLLTRLPLPPTFFSEEKFGRALDLHALSTLPAFVLSQDQTLSKKDVYGL